MLGMDSNIHSHIVALHIQDRIAEAEAARLAREARAPRERRRLWWNRTPAPQPTVVRRQTA